MVTRFIGLLIHGSTDLQDAGLIKLTMNNTSTRTSTRLHFASVAMTPVQARQVMTSKSAESLILFAPTAFFGMEENSLVKVDKKGSSSPPSPSPSLERAPLEVLHSLLPPGAERLIAANPGGWTAESTGAAVVGVANVRQVTRE